MSFGEQNGDERYLKEERDQGIDSPGRLSRTPSPRWWNYASISGRRGTVRTGLTLQPPRKRHGGDLNPRRQGANPDVSRYLRLCIRGWGYVPTGTEAKVTIRTDRGVLLWSSTSMSVPSACPKRSAPRSEQSDGSFEVNTRGSRSSVVTVGPVRDGRRSYRSGSNMAGRAQSRGGPPAQRTHRAVAPEPKGLS